MENLQGTAHVFRQVCLWTLVGFLVILLSGPVLTLLGVLLPFAIVGFLAWLVVQLFVAGPRVAGRMAAATLGPIFRFVVAGPRWVLRTLGAGIAGVFRLISGTTRFVLGLGLRVGGGAAAGAMLGAMGGMQHHDADVRVPAGALIGAGVGLLAWFLRSKPAKTPVVLAVRQPVGRPREEPILYAVAADSPAPVRV